MKTTLLIAGLTLLGVGVGNLSQTSARVPNSLDPAAEGIGRRIANLSGVTVQGKKIQAQFSSAKATVIALTSTTCPLSMKFGPSLAKLESEFAGKGVNFVFVNPTHAETREEMLAHVKRLGLKAPYVADPKHEWIKALRAKTTTEVFVIDSSGTLRYRGALDDQFTLGASLAAPKNRFASNAIEAVVKGVSPNPAATSAPGCLLEEVAQVDAEVPTFHGRVQHIVQKSCLPCHRKGGVAPFTLDSYEAVKSRSKMIKFVVEDGIMPPWFAAPNTGPWLNDHSLSAQEKTDIAAWVDGGTPKGDPKEAPAPATFVEGWQTGKPDLVLELPRAVPIQATGFMDYVNLDVPTGLTEDKWVDRIEVRPGDRRAVHHVLVFVISPGATSDGARIGSFPQVAEVNGFFGAYAPGAEGLVYRPGLAKRLPKGARLRFQMHYTPFGEATTDRSRIGIHFAKSEPKQEVHTASLANVMFRIPPKAERHEVIAQRTIPTDIEIFSFMPHAHVRGAAARYELTRDGKTTVLLDVPRFDFNWQFNYQLKTPVLVKKGDTLTYRAWYDNSEKNPANPDPTRAVGWGDQTYDEMHLGYVEYVVPGQKPGTSAPAPSGMQSRVRTLFRSLDANSDGFVTQEEARTMWDTIKRADTNGDGKISEDEALKMFGG